MLSLVPTIGKHVVMEDAKLGAYTEIGNFSTLHDVVMGDYSYCSAYNQIYYTTMGKFCSLASNVRVNPGNHPSYTRVAQHHFTYRSSYYAFGEDDEDFFAWRKAHVVTIGHDVWIGHNASIMPSVTIGNGAIIGTGAVVTKDVEPYAVVVGVAAKTIKKRFTDEIIEKIEASQWWNWDHETLKERIHDFRDMETFAAKYF